MDQGNDDFFGDDDEGDCFDGELGQREVAAAERNLHTIGFEEGVQIGKERALQKGFDAGFSRGIRPTCISMIL